MVTKRFNLCSAVRNALQEQGISTVRVVDAVNAALADTEVVSTEGKLGDGKVTKATKNQPSWFKVTETVSIKRRGTVSAPLLFDAWHSAVAKAEKIASFEAIELPDVFADWLAKMKEPAKEEQSA